MSLVQDQDISLTDDSDLTVTIIGAAREDGIKHVTDLLVSSEACKKSSYVKALLEESEDKDELTLGGDAKSKEDGNNKEGTLVWLAHLHNLPQERMDELGLFDVSLVEVWHAISAWDFHMDGKIKENLRPWFNDWYERNMSKVELTVPTAQALAYPCYVFDHAIGYARATKYLAYEHIGHVKERPPKGFKGPKHLHINEREFVGKHEVGPLFQVAVLTGDRSPEPRSRRPSQHPTQISLQPCGTYLALREYLVLMLGCHHWSIPARAA
jgi:hypothetical protein